MKNILEVEHKQKNLSHVIRTVAIRRDTMKTIKLLLTLAIFLIAAETAMAANYYVRAGASGNGTDWTNAYGSLPATLVRGSTYYVADGSYGGYTFDDAVSGTLVIAIKKATIAEHGTDIGWNNTYGDGVATFTGQFNITSSYWVIDGVTGLENSGHGFEIFPSSPTNVIVLGSGVSNITLSHINAHEYAEGTSQGGMTSFNQIVKATQGSSFITISHSYFHHVFGCILQTAGSTTDYTIENNYFSNNKSTAAWHAAGICDQNSDNFIVRFNKWKDISGSAILDLISGPDVSNNYQFYGNTVWHTGTYAAALSSIIGVWNDATNWRTGTNWKVYNNTFVNLKGGGGSNMIYFAANCSGCDIKNNYWFCNRGTSTAYTNYMYISGATHTYNYWSNCAHPGAFSPSTGEPGMVSGANCPLSAQNENPFLNWPSGDFRLSQQTSSGASLSSPFNIDVLGNTRGADGIWDRSAYEYVSGSTPSASPGPPGLLQ